MKAETAVLRTDAATLQRSESGHVIGQVWIEAGTTRFPSLGWPDFIIVVISWWAESLIRSLEGHASEQRVPFMDGPYAVAIKADAQGLWRIDLVETRVGGDLAHRHWVSPAPLVASVVSAARATSAVVRAKGWETTESRQLESLMTRLSDLAHTAGLI